MSYIKNLKMNKIAFIDIETCAKTESYFDLSPAGQAAWQYKNKHEGVIPDETELDELYKRSAALYAEFNKIIAVGVGYLTKDGFRIKTISNDDEAELLKELGEVLDTLYTNKFTLCAHSGIYFDYPQLAKAYQGNKLPIPKMLDVCGAKPWEVKLLDTNVLYKSAFTGPGSSLIALCFHLGVPSPKDDIDGSQVSNAYYEGRLSDISAYVWHDVVATFNCLRVMRGEEIIQFEDAIVNEPIPEKPVFDLETTVVMAAKVKGKRQLYKVQGEDNEDYLVKSVVELSKGDEVFAKFNDKQKYYECVV